MSSEDSPIDQHENRSAEEAGERTPLSGTADDTATTSSYLRARLQKGETIGGIYKILDFLGSGGMSDVYMCEDLSVGRTIAVKTLKAGYTQDSLRRFQTEGKAIAKLEHPNIVKLYGLNTTSDGMPILLMEYVPGKTLAQLMERHKALPLQRALKIASQIAEALKSAERQGVIHRDLKPSNIIIVNEGSIDEKAKILDFGIAKIQGEPSVNATQTGEVFGTPKYMSPEQALGKRCDGRADQYAFGCILFEMLSGQAPFHAENAFSLMMAHVQDRVPSLSKTSKQPIPDHLEGVVTKLLQKEPSERYASMDDVSKAIFESQISKNNLPMLLIGASALCLLLIIMSVNFVFQETSKKANGVDKNSLTAPSNIQPVKISTKADSPKPLNEAVEPSQSDNQLLKEADEFKDAVKLELHNQNITDFGLEAIAKAKHLRYLNLSGNRRVTSKGLEKLRSLPLQALNLDGTGIDDGASKSIEQISTLKELDLNNTDISAETCKNLSGLPTLKKLWIGTTGIDGRSLAYFSKISSLEYLNLDNDDVAENLDELHVLQLKELSLKRIPNARLIARKRLMSLKRLESIDLSGTSTDNADLRWLVQLPNLKTIYVNDCKNVSPKVVAEISLRQTVPHIFSNRLSANTADFLLHLKTTGKELVKNGNFDATNLATQYVICHVGENTLKDWEIAKGSVDLVGCFRAASGKNLIDLNGLHSRGTITQSIGTTLGDKYLLQFDATSHPDAPEVPKSFVVRYGNLSETICVPDLGNTRAHMNWEHFTLPFKALSDRTRITFESLNDEDQGACLDSVSVREISP